MLSVIHPTITPTHAPMHALHAVEVPTLDFATKVPFDSYFVRGGFHYVDAMPTAVLRRGETYHAGDFL